MAAIDCSLGKLRIYVIFLILLQIKTEWFLHRLWARDSVSDLLQRIDCQISFYKYIAPTNNRDTRPAQRLD
jgi:hypothetical protein